MGNTNLKGADLNPDNFQGKYLLQSRQVNTHLEERRMLPEDCLAFAYSDSLELEIVKRYLRSYTDDWGLST